jgi:hypothetical protein
MRLSEEVLNKCSTLEDLVEKWEASSTIAKDLRRQAKEKIDKMEYVELIEFLK